MRADGHAEIAEWLQLALDGLRRADDGERLSALRERVLAARDELVGRIWRGELGWSLWVGPFVIAYIGPASPSFVELRAALGPLGVVLADDRVWIRGHGKRLLQLQRGTPLQRGAPLLLASTLPGAEQAICEHLMADLRERFGDNAHDTRAVQGHSGGRHSAAIPPRPHREVRVVVSATRRMVWWTLLDELAGAVVVGPPELLSSQFGARRQTPCFAPLPSFERRYQQLAAAQPALIGQLRAELDERPIAAAHTCPSWPVYVDWLLERGEERLAEWLRLDLAAHDGDEQAAAAVAKLGATLERDGLALVRRRYAMTLRMLWPAGEWGWVGDRTSWLGPFMLSYFDPSISAAIGADELQAILGRHATFLARTRVFVTMDEAWFEGVNVSRSVPTLAPTPPRASLHLAALLVGRAPRRSPAGSMRMAKPGERLEPRPERILATNIGPIAADHEAIALLCCEDESDVLGHAQAWEHLQTFERVILLGTPEVLARWPLAGEWIEPWGTGC